MKMYISSLNKIVLTTLLLGGFVSHGIAQNMPYSGDAQTNSSEITETSPAAGESDVALDARIEVTFAKDMDENSINETTFLLREHAANGNAMSGMQRGEMQRGEMQREDHMDEMRSADQSSNRSEASSENNRMRTSDSVSGTVSYSNRVAVFTPDNDLKEGTMYTVSITQDVKDSEDVALENGHNWSFSTESTSGATLYNEQNNNRNN